MGEHLQDAEDAIEYTILNRRDVNAFQIPPQASSSGHRAEEWKNCIWSGKIWIAAKNNNCIVRLIKPATEEIFLQSVIEGGDHDRYVERTVDSSRYFVLRVVHPQTKKAAFIGLGFEERNDAFDFNCCLSDFKNRNVESEKAEEAAKDRPPPKDYSLKEGEKITIKIGGKKKPSTSTAKDGSATSGPGDGASGGFLPPPPAASKQRTVVQEPVRLDEADDDPFKDDDDFFGDFQSAG